MCIYIYTQWVDNWKMFNMIRKPKKVGHLWIVPPILTIISSDVAVRSWANLSNIPCYSHFAWYNIPFLFYVNGCQWLNLFKIHLQYLQSTKTSSCLESSTKTITFSPSDPIYPQDRSPTKNPQKPRPEIPHRGSSTQRWSARRSAGSPRTWRYPIVCFLGMLDFRPVKGRMRSSAALSKKNGDKIYGYTMIYRDFSSGSLWQFDTVCDSMKIDEKCVIFHQKLLVYQG